MIVASTNVASAGIVASADIVASAGHVLLVVLLLPDLSLPMVVSLLLMMPSFLLNSSLLAWHFTFAVCLSFLHHFLLSSRTCRF